MELAERESKLKSALVLIVVFMAAYSISLFFRLIELPDWRQDVYMVAGEPLMATHDAYGWLAGAKNIGPLKSHPFSEFIGLIHKISGISLGWIGFWLPALLGPLVALPSAYIAYRWAGPLAALIAGICSSASMSYIARTRLGYLDTDVFSLFFPVLIAVGFTVLLEPFCRKSWVIDTKKSKDTADDPPSVYVLLVGSTLIGVCVKLFLKLYGSGFPIAAAIFLIAASISLILARPGLRMNMLVAFSLTILAWSSIIAGIIYAGFIVMYYRHKGEPDDKIRICMGIWAIFLAVLFSLDSIQDLLPGLIGPLTRYLKPAEDKDLIGQVVFPSIYQSVREAQNLEVDRLIEYYTFNWYVFYLMLVFYVYLIWEKPFAALFLPFLMLALAAHKLGMRFTMFGGPAMGLGLGPGIALFLYRIRVLKIARIVVGCAVLFLVTYLLWNRSQLYEAGPCIPKVYAEALHKSAAMIPKNARVWLWWDYGYAAQYLMGRETFADGGDNRGLNLYALALAHADNSTQKVNSMINLVTNAQIARRQQEISLKIYSAEPEHMELYARLPDFFQTMTPEQAAAFIKGLEKKRITPGKDSPPQYLVFSWENVILSYWITYFGSWDLSTAQGKPGLIAPVRQTIDLNPQTGVMTLKEFNATLQGALLFEPEKSTAYSWDNATGVFLLANTFSRNFYLVDDRLYNSLMIKMLLRDPKEFEPFFKLVYSDYPWVRVYKVE